ncbi:MAG: Cna B-type domain-containing protein, partial [Anaerovoracaceae bacterium]|nr:Cna B-type domain-containing protein [Anaerovoracaceae bacterium]
MRLFAVLMTILVCVSLMPQISGAAFADDNTAYKVTFDVGGHGTAPDAIQVKAGEKIPAEDLKAPEAEGWTFEGWYKETDTQNAWDADTDVVNADTTLYAKWDEAADSGSSQGGGMTVKGAAIPEYVYLDGSSGDDSKDGYTEKNAVKTFAAAKEALKKLDAPKGIIITNTVKINGSEKWSLSGIDNVKIYRKDGCSFDMVSVLSGTLTLEDITLTGTKIDGSAVRQRGSVVSVYGGDSKLVMNSGSVIENNDNSSNGEFAIGGGVYIDEGTALISGGTVKNCKSILGGGIGALYKGSVILESGSISGNTAGRSDASHQSAGGGVFLGEQSNMTMTGGNVSDNYSWYSGGGIALGSTGNSIWVYDDSRGYTGKNTFSMSGGTISGNSTRSCGGGLFVQANTEATITGGTLSGNKAECDTWDSMYGGGAVYVNYGVRNNLHFPSGVLRLKDVEITDNEAAIRGGGLAGCTTSNSTICLENGSVIYSNRVKDEKQTGREIYISEKSVDGDINIVSPFMLGGAPYLWRDSNTKEYIDAGDLTTDKSLALYNDYTANDPEIQNAVSKARVHITGNSSDTRGGGIGANGSVYIGTSDDDTVDISVSKMWDDDGDTANRPDSIRFWLLRDGQRVAIETMTKDSDGKWQAVTFKDMPKEDASGHEYKYTVEEDMEGMPEEYQSYVLTGGENNYTVVNTTHGVKDIPVIKSWDDNNDEKGIRPDSITVRLLANGNDTGKSVTLSADGGWKGSFTGLPVKDLDGNEIEYSVSEDEVSGYASAIVGGEDGGFTITNSITPNDENPPVTPPDDNPQDENPPGNSVSTPGSNPEGPVTGDTGNISLILLVMVAALGGIG